MTKLWKYRERLNVQRHLSREQVDFVRTAVSEESGGLREMVDSLRNQPHEPDACEIRCNWIVG
ncbi:MAG: hypothetical protein ACRD7E_22500 [Bryobacteraceae bacterium]